MSDTVQLNDQELSLVRYLARLRYSQNREGGIENQRIGPQSDEKTDINGLLGEIGVAKYYNLWPTEAFSMGGSDLAIPWIGSSGSVSVDVKATEYTDGHLIAQMKEKHDNPSHVYVLTVINDSKEGEVEVVGWIQADRLLREEMKDHFGYGYVFAASQDQLNSPETLKRQM